LGKGYHIPQRPAEASEPGVLECEEVLLPFFTLQPVYGHWLLEAVSSLWAWDEVCRLAGERRPKLLLYPVHEAPAYVREFCRPFGITEADYFFPSSCCMRLHRIFLPTRAYMHMAYVSTMAKTVWSRIASYHDKFSSLTGMNKMYVSRSRVKGRKLLNESECEKFFARRGFQSVHPQELPLADQIRLFAEARYIAGPVGSAVHNVVFSRHPGDLKTLFLAPRDFASLSAIAAIEHGYGRTANFVYGSARDKEGPNVWSLDGTNLEKAVEQWLNE
jgi:capsular polysaccharide biosynthesis protein